MSETSDGPQLSWGPETNETTAGPLSSATSLKEAAANSVVVTFSGEALAALTQVSDQTGKNVGEVLREAIALARWYEQVREEGGRVLVDRRGKLSELVRV